MKTQVRLISFPVLTGVGFPSILNSDEDEVYDSCDACGEVVPFLTLEPTDDGGLVCPDCREELGLVSVSRITYA